MSMAEKARHGPLAEAYAEAEASLSPREMLLAKSITEFCNGLMLVSAFVMREARDADLKTRASLERVQSRVTSIGLVHETLHSCSDRELSHYLDRLVPDGPQAWGPPSAAPP